MQMNDTGSPRPGVPTLGKTQAEHCARVREHVLQAMRGSGGWISFERYMELVLYAPGLGYYSAGATKLGADGDFTTAPELSALYGACVARQCAEVLDLTPRGEILEAGAGTGRLAADVLLRLARSGQLPARYAILEVSGDLRARQRATLERLPAELYGLIEWLAEPPASFAGVILANEVLDALPVRRFRWAPGRVEEFGVRCEAGRFVWAASPADGPMSEYCERLAAAAGWEPGYISEFCPRMPIWAAAIAASLSDGAVLWFDYGLPRAQYYLPERHEGTLLCHFRHRTETDPFRFPGLQDITAWVDFTALAQAARDAGCRVTGFTTQTYFLAGLGIDEEMQAIAAADPGRTAALANEARQLMMPGAMGESFKAMLWVRGAHDNLSGFRLRDLRHTL
jgi:SAM-dependent MidA family methyltransferase